MVQVRLAAQELLVAELKNLGEAGRKALVEAWSGFIPKYGDPPFQSNGASAGNGSNSGQMSHSSSASLSQHLVDEEEEDR